MDPAELWTPAALKQAVEDAGGVIGVTAASAALGIPSSNFKRYRARLTAIPVEGSADVFSKREVEALAEELAGRRAERVDGD